MRQPMTRGALYFAALKEQQKIGFQSQTLAERAQGVGCYHDGNQLHGFFSNPFKSIKKRLKKIDPIHRAISKKVTDPDKILGKVAAVHERDISRVHKQQKRIWKEEGRFIERSFEQAKRSDPVFRKKVEIAEKVIEHEKKNFRKYGDIAGIVVGIWCPPCGAAISAAHAADQLYLTIKNLKEQKKQFRAQSAELKALEAELKKLQRAKATADKLAAERPDLVLQAQKIPDSNNTRSPEWIKAAADVHAALLEQDGEPLTPEEREATRMDQAETLPPPAPEEFKRAAAEQAAAKKMQRPTMIATTAAPPSQRSATPFIAAGLIALAVLA